MCRLTTHYREAEWTTRPVHAWKLPFSPNYTTPPRKDSCGRLRAEHRDTRGSGKHSPTDIKVEQENSGKFSYLEFFSSLVIEGGSFTAP
ncbi:hypothetical protein E2C01_060998 [Portunus trituberculatus]|uniref:Uncharacterized protein n=1 Tax=Portunus trituberculatus TaxID=210409 RepID=A0A5B7HDW1_PORTR|nr:hypothetical protein [Portunus trituberculatus]